VGSAGAVEGLAVTVEITESGVVTSRLARGVAGPRSYQPSQCGIANTNAKVIAAASTPIQMPRNAESRGSSISSMSSSSSQDGSSRRGKWSGSSVAVSAALAAWST
jgi:hypothetical protein